MIKIWSSEVDIDDYKDYLEECFPGVTDDDEKYKIVSELNEVYLDDERINLRIDVGSQIIEVADLGFWNGRRQGYHLITSGLLSDIFNFHGCDDATFFIEDGELRSTLYHHDGHHNIVYRKVKNMKKFHEMPLDEFVRKYTESLADAVKKVYGWKE